MADPPARSTGARALAALAALALVAGPACDRASEVRDDLGDTSTTAGMPSLDEQGPALELSIAATGMNLVASDVGIRTAGAGARDYCRTEAPAELEPHRATLGAAADPEVRRLARVALDRLSEAIEVCAGGAEAGAVRMALDRYRESYEPLRRRIDVLVQGG